MIVQMWIAQGWQLWPVTYQPSQFASTPGDIGGQQSVSLRFGRIFQLFTHIHLLFYYVITDDATVKWFRCWQRLNWVWVPVVRVVTNFIDKFVWPSPPSGSRKHMFCDIRPGTRSRAKIKGGFGHHDVRAIWAAGERPFDERFSSYRWKSFSLKLALRTQFLSGAKNYPDFQEICLSKYSQKCRTFSGNCGNAEKMRDFPHNCGTVDTYAFGHPVLIFFSFPESKQISDTGLFCCCTNSIELTPP